LALEDAQVITHDCRSYLESLPAITSCDGQLLRQLFEAGTSWLEKHANSINALNVFPVPDGDTGTNMLLTMKTALHELTLLSEQTASAVAQSVSHGALMGARGNSGVILSQLLRGLSKGLTDREQFGAKEFAKALSEASATAYKAVMKPVEGTILTVSKDAATAASVAADEIGDVAFVLCVAVEAARRSVERTPALLPVLAEAGVVDAGGQGLMIFLEGMLRFLRGDSVDVVPAAITTAVGWAAFHPAHAEEESSYGYEVMYLVQGANLDVDAVRETISTMGDSVVVVGDEKQIKIHVHTPEPGNPLTYGVTLGTLRNIVVENLQIQADQLAHREAPGPSPLALAKAAAHKGGIAVVAVSPGQGISRVFESLGASAIVPGGQTMNPSTEQLLRAVEELAAEEVVILPNNGNIFLTAQQVDVLTEKRVRVVGSTSVPQGIGAILAFNYQTDLETNAKTMEQAAKNIQTIEVTRAIRSAQVNGLTVEAGQAIGLINGKLTSCSAEINDVIKDALTALNADDYEIVTIYYGENIIAEEAQALLSELEEAHPFLEYELIQGGQSHYHYIISLE